MGDQSLSNAADEAASRARVIRGALRQIARHEHAIEACLSELGGAVRPTSSQVTFVLRRAGRHVERAHGLATMAARINRDPNAAAGLAAVVERQERAALRVQGWSEVSAEALSPRPVREAD